MSSLHHQLWGEPFAGSLSHSRRPYAKGKPGSPTPAQGRNQLWGTGGVRQPRLQVKTGGPDPCVLKAVMMVLVVLMHGVQKWSLDPAFSLCPSHSKRAWAYPAFSRQGTKEVLWSHQTP